jgi:hypothetical protein
VTAVARHSSKNTARLWENSARLCKQSRVLQEAIGGTIEESKIAVAEARQVIAKIKNSRVSLHLPATNNPKKSEVQN